MKPSAFLIGTAAGIAAALLFAGLILQSATAVVLALAAPIPIFIASLGWGSLAGFVAAASAAGGIALALGSVASGVMLLASMALPAAIVGHLAGLARPSYDRPAAGPFPSSAPVAPALDWYPLARILSAISFLAAGGCLFIGWLVGYNPAELGPEIADALSAQLGTGAEAVSPEQLQDLTRLMVQVVPFLQPALLVAVLVACLHISAAITRMSGRLPRPKDDIPASAGLPKAALPIFALALAGCFTGGVVATISAVFVGTFGTSFTMVGLAAFHRRTRGTGHRGLLLFSAYASILFLSFPLLAATVLGVFETARRPTPAGVPD